MGVIQVVSNRPGAGKTCLISALMSDLQEQGQRVAYYRPFSPSPENDPDVRFVSEQLLAGEGNPPVPQPAGQVTALNDQLAQQVQEAVSALNTTDSTVFVEGPDLGAADGPGAELAGQLASILDSKVLLMAQYVKGLTEDDVIGLGNAVGDRLAGVVINGFPPKRRREISQELTGALAEKGVPVLGAIPDDRYMLAVTVQQIADHLGGRWVQEPVNTDACIDRFLIGGNIMDSGPHYFGRYRHQAVITRAERPDIQMASLMSDTKCLVLTGGAEPTEYIRVEASQREVPLILVDSDTISTAEALNGLLEQANAYSLQKVRRFRELVQEYLNPAMVDGLFA